ncbi:MAG: superinfection immunity protein [Sandaracinobacter sp.]
MFIDNALVIGAGLLAVLVINFVPSVLAFARRHPDRRLIASLNLLSLVSFLLWFALVSWAALGRRDNSVLDRYMADPTGKRRALVGLLVIFLVGAALTYFGLRDI